MKLSTTLYLLWVGNLAVTAQAAITWDRSCDETRKEKVLSAFADASKMASTVITHWNGVTQTSMKNYFSGVKSADKIKDIKQVFAKIATLNTYDLNVMCVYTYDDRAIFGPSKCKNREVAYVDIQDKQATNNMVFCPPFFSTAINKFLDTSKTEICALKSSQPEQPYKTYVSAEDAFVPAGTYSRKYDQMIEWLAHEFPGKWVLHELTHTLEIGGHITSMKTAPGLEPWEKKGTTDVETPSGEVAYGKRRVKELKTEISYENADSYAWLAWTVYRDVCQKGATEGEACSLTKRAGAGTGKGKGKGKGGAATPGKGPCNGKPPAKKPPVKNPAVKNPAVKNPAVKNPAVKKPPVKTPLKKPAPAGKKPVPGGKRPAPAGKRPAPAGKRPAVKKPAIKKPAAKKPAAKRPAAKKKPAA